MFKIEAFCEDPVVPKVLRYLADYPGTLYNVRAVPADEAPDNRAPPKISGAKNGQPLNYQIASLLANAGTRSFTMDEMGNALVKIGRKNNSGNRAYAIKALKRSKLAKPTNRKGVYVLTDVARKG
jgi:hypothetical protein